MAYLYVLPIEPLNERYSQQWLTWTRDYLEKNSVSYSLVTPRSSYRKITNGKFLDNIGTNVYKQKQLQYLLGLFELGHIKPDSVIWVHDLWFPGIEMLAYIKHTMAIPFKIYGMLHAGTYDPYDYVSQCGIGVWGKHFEEMLLNMVEKVFVATHFHKNLILKQHLAHDKKIKVTGFPIYKDHPYMAHTVPWHARKKIIVFPHRMDVEKDPVTFRLMKEDERLRGYDFYFTKEQATTKDEYYDLLSRARYAVSFSKQETWGIAMQESVLCGCCPIVPNRLSYAEMYQPQFVYKENLEDCIQKILQFDTEHHTYVEKLLRYQEQKFLQCGQQAFDKMFDHMGLIHE